MNIRESALRVLLDMESNGTKSHIAVQNELLRHPEITPQDRRFLRHLVRGTLEKQMLLDARIQRKSSVKVKKMKPVIRQILRMSAYQLFFMDRVPDSAVCNEAVKLVQRYSLQGLKGFVNGVLRAMAREENWPAETESVQYSVPQWILDLWNREYGEEACRAMLTHLSDETDTFFRIRPPRQGEEDPCEQVLASLREEGAAAEPALFPPGAYVLRQTESLEELAVMKEGRIRIQDISSMMVGYLSGAEDLPGEDRRQEALRILDVCAAPGGKSMHLADLVGDAGCIISCDLTDYKVELIRENIRRAGLANMTAVKQDALVFRPEWEDTMDLVIADLPCSGLGVIGRKPEIRYNVTPEEVAALARLQRDILTNIHRYVKPGGLLLYSTCTVTPEENRMNRQWILEELPFLAEEWPPEKIPEHFRGRCEGGCLQILQGTDPCDGFYLARFRRKADGAPRA